MRQSRRVISERWETNEGSPVAPAYCHERASRPRCRMGDPGWSLAGSLSWRDGVGSSRDTRPEFPSQERSELQAEKTPETCKGDTARTFSTALLRACTDLQGQEKNRPDRSEGTAPQIHTGPCHGPVPRQTREPSSSEDTGYSAPKGLCSVVRDQQPLTKCCQSHWTNSKSRT